jgi:hypothetical protein
VLFLDRRDAILSPACFGSLAAPTPIGNLPDY